MPIEIPPATVRTSTEPQTLRSPGGGTEIRVSDGRPEVVITSPAGVSIVLDAGTVRISGPAGVIEMNAGGITLTGAQVTVEAALLNARMIRCNTIMADSVVGASYTPGAGNVW